MSDTPTPAAQAPKAGGCGPTVFIAIIFIICSVLFGNFGFGFYMENCAELDIVECAQELAADEAEEEGTVTASGPYSYEGNSVTVTLNIPLEGGAVTGSMSGDCKGRVTTATYNGEDNGAISGTISGTCSVFLVNVPASATFGGTVNKDAKSVPISFDGKGGGISHSGSMVLGY